MGDRFQPSGLERQAIRPLDSAVPSRMTRPQPIIHGVIVSLRNTRPYTSANTGMISEPAAQTEAVLTPDGVIRLRVHYWVASRNVPTDLGTRVIAAVTKALTP